MRALALLVAVGLPFVHRATGSSCGTIAPGRHAAFANPPPSALHRPAAQRQSSCANALRELPTQARRAVQQASVARVRPVQRLPPGISALSCTATDSTASTVTVLEGTFNIDGFRSNYIVARPQLPEGATAAVPLVLIHGFGSNKAHFAGNLEALAGSTGSAVYALDLLGHGESAKPQGVSYDSSLWDWQVETLVKDVIGQRVLLVGHSLGGYIAMRMAARAPRTVAGLCLIAPAGRYGVLHPLSFNFPGLGLGPVATALGQETFKKFCTPEAMRKTLKFLYKDGAEVSQKLVLDLAAPWLDPKSQQAGQAICKAIYQSRLEAPWEKLISSDEVKTVVPKRTRTGAGQETFVTQTYCGPLLTIWGRDDGFLPPETNVQAIKELRPDDLSEVYLVEAGHCPHDEKPEEVNAVIAKWAAKVQEEDVEFPVPRRPRYRNAPILDESVWRI